jgi:hypothetical protein
MEIASPVVVAPALTATSVASAPPLADSAATALSSGSSLAMEHFEAAQRKGVSASDISYTATSAFENAGAYTPPVIEPIPAITAMPSVDMPDIESEARVNFAEAMPSQRQTGIANTEREGRADETPRQNIFHIANMNLNADELRTLFDFVHQIELAVIEPEAVMA